MINLVTNSFGSQNFDS